MQDPYFLLWLEAPLQAWGHDSRFGRRESLPFPTKSGLLGLICCALGAAGEQRELLAAFADLDLHIMAYSRTRNRFGHGVQQPLLRDFHMVGSGYDAQDLWQSLMIPKTSAGKSAVGGGTKMTYRYYIQDMAFGAALQVPAAFAEQVKQALQQPVWDIYLGRKNCAPTELIYQGCFASFAELEAARDQFAAEKAYPASFQVQQGEHEGEVLILNDVPLQFGPVKQYRERRVTYLEFLQPEEA